MNIDKYGVCLQCAYGHLLWGFSILLTTFLFGYNYRRATPLLVVTVIFCINCLYTQFQWICSFCTYFPHCLSELYFFKYNFMPIKCMIKRNCGLCFRTFFYFPSTLLCFTKLSMICWKLKNWSLSTDGLRSTALECWFWVLTFVLLADISPALRSEQVTEGTQ